MGKQNIGILQANTCDRYVTVRLTTGLKCFQTAQRRGEIIVEECKERFGEEYSANFVNRQTVEMNGADSIQQTVVINGAEKDCK